MEEEDDGEDGVVVVVVVGMKEEMMERVVVEKLVVEEMERSGRQGRMRLVFFGAAVGLCWLEEEERKKRMKEREGKRCIYIKE